MKLVNQTLSLVKRNSPTILSSAAVTGVVSTAYLTGKASFAASRKLSLRSRYDISRREAFKEDVQKVWKLYIPAAASGAMTIACIVGSNRIGARRMVAAQAAFVLTERAYSEYKDHVVEEFGEKADQKIRDKIAEKRVRENPPTKEILVVNGEVLCCELFTRRYFKSDMETLRRAENELNAKLLSQDQVSFEEWYYLIGLEPTTFSSDVGWTSDKLMKLEFSSVLTEDGQPCLAFEYNYHRSLYDICKW
jgi:hypothetical protein